MKTIILYIDSMQKGGANRVMANLANYYVERNYNVILVNDIMPIEGTPEYSVNSSVKRIFLDVVGKNTIQTNWKRILRLRKIIISEKAEVVLSFMGPPNIRMLLASFLLPCRKVVSVRNDPAREYGSSKLMKSVANVLFLLADGCVFQTEDASKYFWPIIRNKSKIIFNPVDDIFYCTERKRNVHNIITVGRLFPQKNQKLLIKAFQRVSNIFPDEKLFIYGEGSLRDELEEYVVQVGLQNRVFLPGNISNVNLKLSESKVFVLSSDFEGMPNALMEAMAVGVPVISTDCPCGGPRTLLSNDSGILVPCNDEESLAKALATMLQEDTRKYYQQRAFLRAQDFKSDLIFQEWENYLFGTKNDTN